MKTRGAFVGSKAMAPSSPRRKTPRPSSSMSMPSLMHCIMTSPTSRCRFARGIAFLFADDLGVGSWAQCADAGHGRGLAPAKLAKDGVDDLVNLVGGRCGRDRRGFRDFAD